MKNLIALSKRSAKILLLMPICGAPNAMISLCASNTSFNWEMISAASDLSTPASDQKVTGEAACLSFSTFLIIRFI